MEGALLLEELELGDGILGELWELELLLLGEGILGELGALDELLEDEGMEGALLEELLCCCGD